jgi:hypothetical protein
MSNILLDGYYVFFAKVIAKFTMNVISPSQILFQKKKITK